MKAVPRFRTTTRYCPRNLVLGATALGLFRLALAPASAQDLNVGVTVTARKRQESEQQVPVAIAAFGAQQIQERQLTNLEQVADAVPQLIIGRANVGSGAQLSLELWYGPVARVASP